MNESPLRQYGKEYFRQLLNNVSENLKMGDELHFGMRFYNDDGTISHEVVEVINKSELYECD